MTTPVRQSKGEWTVSVGLQMGEQASLSPIDGVTVHCPARGEGQSSLVPMVVDLDGTLTLTDTLAESVVRAVRSDPLNILRLFRSLATGRAGFKSAVSAFTDIPVQTLPYRQPLIQYLAAEGAKGRRLIMATAAHTSIAQRVADHLGLFDEVLASTGDINLKGEVKLARIQQSVGSRFIYAGDSAADVPIWRASQGAIMAGAPAAVCAAVRKDVPVLREFLNEPAGVVAWLEALRVHQWLKNLLVFVPLLTSFAFFDMHRLAAATLAFLAMSMCASATYIANDFWDLESDRRHPRKRFRPFACGRLPIARGARWAALLLAASLAIAAAVNPLLVVAMAVYLVLTTAYSWFLKTRALADVIVLSMLYTLRIVAGSVAVNVPISHWLLAFAVFSFLSMALAKRCAELVALRQAGSAVAPGRDYRVSDLEVLWPFGVGSSIAAVIIFGLFISSPDTAARYGAPGLLWFGAIGFIHLFARLWITTVRGRMHDDPVVHLLGDRGSQIILVAIAATMLAAHFLQYP